GYVDIKPTPGIFSLTVHDRRQELLVQYLFEITSVSPIDGYIYEGFEPAHSYRVTDPEHLQALMGLMRRVEPIFLQDMLREFMEYPMIDVDAALDESTP